MSLDLTRVDAAQVLHCRVGLARALRGATTLEEAAQTACRYFYESIRAQGGEELERACALVRVFKTHPYGLLQPELQDYAGTLLDGGVADADTPCLVLLASVGDEASWCSRHASSRRRCLPVASAEALERAPMWSRFFCESGVDAATLWRDRSPSIVDPSSWAVNVFCVEEASDAASIPDQASFVRPFGIASVFGFCGRLRRGDIFVLVLFSRARVTRDVAARLRPLALDLTSAFFRFTDDQVFATPAETAPGRTI